MKNHSLIFLTLIFLSSCGTEADQYGVAAICDADKDCNPDTDPPLECLANFKGGYCGLADCAEEADCPESAVCVKHDDGKNYCFRACNDKAECNQNRPADLEANCSANITLVKSDDTKACVPPSGE